MKHSRKDYDSIQDPSGKIPASSEVLLGVRTMILPTIHLNGTNQRDLLEDWLKVSHSLGTSLEVMANNGPNARDYYPQGQSAINTAVDEHADRIKRLTALKLEIDKIVEHVADANGGLDSCVGLGSYSRDERCQS
jgi:hypothetical protein